MKGCFSCISFTVIISIGTPCVRPMEMMTVKEMQEKHPFMEGHDLEGGLWDPLDGDIDPAQLTQA
ncbi:MAG: hypothetical protein AAFY66_16125, partial [Pseudomonadota bacterium]